MPSKNYESPRILWEQQLYRHSILSSTSLATGFDEVEDGGELEMES